MEGLAEELVDPDPRSGVGEGGSAVGTAVFDIEEVSEAEFGVSALNFMGLVDRHLGSWSPWDT